MWWLLWLLPLVYVLQNLAMPFNHSSEEALLADIIRSIHAGELPFRDFIDIYGPVNWIGPVLAYGATGGKWIAVRAWMVAVQMGTAILAYQLVRRLASRFQAWLAVSLIFALFGMAWFLHYVPYAFMHVYPMALGMLWCLLLRDASNTSNTSNTSRASRRSLGAGVLAGLALFTKLSSGAFLLAGGLFVCFYLLPPVTPIREAPDHEPESARQRAIFFVRIAGLLIFAAVFTLFIRPHFELGYLLHLSLPMLLLLVGTAMEERAQLRGWSAESWDEQIRYRLRHTLLLVAGFLASVGVCSLGLLSLGMLGPMIDGLTGVLGQLDYHAPFDSPIYGKPLYRFDRAHWPELPWLVSALFAVVLVARFRSRAASAETTAAIVSRLQLLGFFGFTVVAHHVIYPTGDLGHLLQSFVPWILMLAITLHSLETPWPAQLRSRFRVALALCGVIWIATIVEVPFELERYRWRADDEAGLSPHADHLKLRSDFPHLYDYGDFSSPAFQRDLVEVAQFLRSRKEEGDEAWVLSPFFAVYFFADLPMYGGRHSWLIYSMTHGRLSRAGLESLAGTSPGFDPLDPLPRFIVDYPGVHSAVLKGAFPELEELLASVYRPVLVTGTLSVHELEERRQGALDSGRAGG